MFDIALGIFLFLSPIIFLFGNNARVNGAIGALEYYQFKTLSLSGNNIQLLFFQVGIIALFIIALMNKPIREFKNKWIACLLGVCSISIIAHPKTMNLFVPILLGFIFYYLIVTYTKNIKNILWVIATISFLNTVFAILQFFGINILYNSEGGIKGLMYISNQLGFYQALSIPICYYLNPLLVIIPLIGLILSKSILALIAVSVGMAYLLFPKIKKLRFSLISLQALVTVFIVFLIKYSPVLINKFSIRMYVWKETLLQVSNNLFGYGLSNFNVINPGYGQYDNPYSLYLQTAQVFGIFGMIFLILFLKDKFFNYKLDIARAVFASCLTLLVIGLGFCFMDYPRLAGTAIFLFGLLTITKGVELENQV